MAHPPRERNDKRSALPAGQDDLLKSVLNEFRRFFAPGSKVVYVGDTGDRWDIFDDKALSDIGVVVDVHRSMPNVVVHRRDKNWLFLVEAVTSHGPIRQERRRELAKLFKDARAELIYVTAFLDRRSMVRFLGDISWETEVWVADAPAHMIHFDGEKFLGPYDR